MKIKYIRFKIFRFLLEPFSAWSRRRRMRSFAQITRVRDGMTVLDLGGQPMIWDSISTPLNVTILNLPDIAVSAHASKHQIRYVEGDACRVEGVGERPFDIVFSNSVIEHVGAADKRAAFANEVRRLGKSYWVQTPTMWFPIEAHNGMPFWWFYPARLRQRLIERWRKKLPAWTQMVEDTTVLTRAELQHLFPDAAIKLEYAFLLPKSYIVYRV
jgi:hypothetical protein